MHLLHLFGRAKPHVVVTPPKFPRRKVAVRVVSEIADAPQGPAPSPRSAHSFSTNAAAQGASIDSRRVASINSVEAVSTTRSPAAETGLPQTAPGDLRRRIFAAVVSNDFEQLAKMFRENAASVVERASDWMRVPDELQTNPAAVRWYGEGLYAVTEYCAERLNCPDLFERLEELWLSMPDLF